MTVGRRAARRSVAAFTTLATLAACGRVAPKAAPAVDPAIAATAPVVPGSCPHTGAWSLCAVRERLDHAGLVALPAPDSIVRRPFFAASGVVYALGQAQLEVYVYADSARLARDVAAMDTVAVAGRGQKGDWPAPPTFIRSSNLLAVLLTANERQIERVQLALTAGPPLRDRPGEAQSR